jgi:hypothetical protein
MLKLLMVAALLTNHNAPAHLDSWAYAGTVHGHHHCYQLTLTPKEAVFSCDGKVYLAGWKGGWSKIK